MPKDKIKDDANHKTRKRKEISSEVKTDNEILDSYPFELDEKLINAELTIKAFGLDIQSVTNKNNIEDQLYQLLYEWMATLPSKKREKNNTTTDRLIEPLSSNDSLSSSESKQKKGFLSPYPKLELSSFPERSFLQSSTTTTFFARQKNKSEVDTRTQQIHSKKLQK